MEINESIRSDHQKRVVFDIVDAPKGNMAVGVKSCGDNRPEKSDRSEKHSEIPKDNPTEPSEINNGSEVCGQEWRYPQINQNEEDQGSNDRGLVLTEKKSESEAYKGQLSGQTEGVEIVGDNRERVMEEKKEVLTQSEESLQQ